MKTRFLSLLLLPAALLTSPARADEAAHGPFGNNSLITGMRGNLYDLKNTPERELTDVAPNGGVNSDECYEAIEDLAKKGFRQKDLDEYRIGDTSCDMKYLSFGITGADAAPAAFGSPEIDPTGIIILYKGVIEEAPQEEIRFAGLFDDAMLVLVNDKVVFFTAWVEDKTKYKSKEISKQRKARLKGDEGVGMGDAYGDYIQLRKGDVIQIAIAEIPGGHIGGALKVQVKGKTYETDKFGDPILPPFVVGELTENEKNALGNSGTQFNMNDIPVFKFAIGE
ncbi:MAG: hypothetical protein ABJQ29_01695 [Luteolibacter sp.]